MAGAWQLSGWPNTRAIEIGSALFVPALSLLFVPLTIALAAKSGPGRSRYAWVAMTVTLASWAIAEWIWAYYRLVVGRTPQPSWADAAYLFSIPALVVTLLLFPSARTRGAQRRLLLDGLILTLSFFLISWLAVVRRVWYARSDSGPAFALAISYPIADFLVLALGFLVLLKVAPNLRLTLTLLVVGLACGAIGDSVSAFSTTSEAFTPGGLRVLLATGAALLVIVALVAAYNAEPATPAVDTVPSRALLWLPLVPLLAAGVFVAFAPNDVVLEAPVVVPVFALIVATLVRQVLEAAEAVEREQEIRLLAAQLSIDLSSAAKYVASILPGELAGPVRVESRYLPSRAVGGDSFGYEWTDNHLVFYLIDVSGHGVEPALLSVSVHNLLRSGSLSPTTLLAPDQVLTELNELFSMENHADHYFTMWYGVYQLSTGRLRYASAGHPPALVLTEEDNTVCATQLAGGSIPVGMFNDSVFDVESCRVPAAARIVVYSDGVLGDPPRMAEFVATCEEWAATPPSPLDSLVERLAVLADTEVEQDDRSVILLEFPAENINRDNAT